MRTSGLFGVLCGALLWCTTQVDGAGVARWEFNGSFEEAGGGAALGAEAVAPAGAPETEFLDMDIDGTNAQVARFSKGTCFRMTHSLGANGGGQYLNAYSLIMDVMFPDPLPDFTSLWQTNETNGNDGDWFIRGDGGLGISGNYGGLFTNGVWHRVVLVLDSPGQIYISYLDGTQVQQLAAGSNGLGLDQRWTLGPTALVFADEDEENNAGYINSLQLRPFAMTADEVAALGVAEAEGIPVPVVDDCVPMSVAEDCNGNNVKDSCDIKFATSTDCDADGVPDECQIAADPSLDCDKDGTLDSCRLALDPRSDCDASGTLDACDIAATPALDCDKNGVLDSCELTRFDSNDNGILDACDIAGGVLKDCNANGIPDGAEIGLVQWDFDGDLTETFGGDELLPYVTLPATEPQYTFEEAQIGGQTAQVARVGRGTALQITQDLGANAGGTMLNRYTLLMDVSVGDRTASGGWAVLFQTSPANADDGEWFVNDTGGVGISSNYGGNAGDGGWHRIALVVDLAKGTFTSYVDGVFAMVNGLDPATEIDGRFAVPEMPFLFADENEENAEILVNSVQLRCYPMSAEEIAALAGPTAAGFQTNDCNNNGVPDSCDITGGTSTDTNANGIPDDCERPPETSFKRGDTNADRTVNIADAIYVLGYLFAKGNPPTCLKTGDTNDDGQVNIADAIRLLGHLFASTGPLPPPFAACGTETTTDTLTCISFTPCAP